MFVIKDPDFGGGWYLERIKEDDGCPNMTPDKSKALMFATKTEAKGLISRTYVKGYANSLIIEGDQG